MKKSVILVATLIILLVSLVNAQESWTHPIQNTSYDFTIDKGQTVLFSDISYDLGSVSGISQYPMLIGDVDADSQDEIFTVYEEGFLIFNVSLTLKYNLTVEQDFFFDSSITSNDFYVLYDYDSDNKEELIVMLTNTSDSNKGVLRVYDYVSGWVIDVERRLTQTVSSRPVCYDGFCYFSDTVGNLYKYNPSTDTIVTTISTTGTGGSGFLSVQECNQYQSGLELVSVGDYDADGETDDFILVPLNNFTSGAQNIYYFTQNPLGLPSASSFVQPGVTCGQIGANTYIGLAYGFQQTSGGACTFDDIRQAEAISLVHINSSGIAENVTTFTASYDTRVVSGVPRSQSNIMFYDVNNDGTNEYCYGQVHLSADCGSTIPHNYEITCRNVTGDSIWNVNQDVRTTMSWADGTWDGNLYVGDFDGDNLDEFMYGGAIIHINSMVFQDLSLNDDDSTWMSYRSYGNQCVNYYYPTANSGRFVNVRLSEDNSCDFGQSASFNEVLFYESFLTNLWVGLDASECSEDSYTSASVSASTSLELDNTWHCYIDDAFGENAIWDSTGLTSRINTVYGLLTRHQGVVEPNHDSFVSLLNATDELNLDQSDEISFYCDGSLSASDNYHYLALADYNLVNEPVVLALEANGCNFAEDVYENGTNLNCCPIFNITGSYCSSGKTFQDFTVEDVIDACSAIGDLDFQDIGRIDLWRNRYNTTEDDYFYFDDLSIIRPAVISNNTLPNILFLDPTPNQAEPNQSVNWGTSVSDNEESSGEIYSAFDCDISDGTLDYNWALRGITLNFACSYTSTGNYTGKLTVSDTAHYPLFNVSETGVVEILSEVDEEPVQGGNCVGFSAPACSGSCYFNDDFQYNNPVECNGWEGTARDVNPTSGMFSVFSLPVTKYYIEVDGDSYSEGSIFESQYDNFEVEFDFKLTDTSTVQFDILNDDLDQYLAFVLFKNFNIEVYSPGKTTIDTVGQDEWHNLRMLVDLENDQISWYIDDDFKLQSGFFDGTATSARNFRVIWSSVLADFDIDDFQITYGTLNPNATVPEEEEVDYVYNPELFCAINWTGETGERFVEQNCIDRGYSVEYPLIALCNIRACISDTKSVFVNFATDNILETIIIVTAFILIAPLLMKLRK